jgi:hypothetical protein
MTEIRTRTSQPRSARAPRARRGAPSRGAWPPRAPGRRITLTTRGAIVALFAGCFLSQLFAAWTGWSAFADVVFVMGCGLVTYHAKPSGLRHLVVCPPLVFFAACACCQAIVSAGAFSFLEGLLVTLGLAARWLFTGTALTIVIAFGRGFRVRLPSSLSGWLRSLSGRRVRR